MNLTSTKVLKEIWALVGRQFPSAQHAEHWKDYEMLLIYRSLFSLASRILYATFSAIAGNTVWQISDEYLTNELYNDDLKK